MKDTKIKEVCQFRISLDDVKPSVWRRILVPSSYSFWDLHVAVQDAMGWADYHLHIFRVKDPITDKKVEIGLPDKDDLRFGWKILPDHKEKILKYFTEKNPTASYEYDFGDGWLHSIRFEGLIPASSRKKYPECTAGKKACPPEDCGGPQGYYNMLKILKDPGHEDYEMMMDWTGGGFNPDYFDPEDVDFEDPGERFDMMMGSR